MEMDVADFDALEWAGWDCAQALRWRQKEE